MPDADQSTRLDYRLRELDQKGRHERRLTFATNHRQAASCALAALIGGQSNAGITTMGLISHPCSGKSPLVGPKLNRTVTVTLPEATVLVKIRFAK